MIDTRFWVLAKARLQFLADAEIHQHEFVNVDFGSRTGASCHLSPMGFARIARKFGMKQINFSKFVRDQPYFYHEGIRFVCVCSESVFQSLREDFEMVCVDSELKEAGF